MDMATAITIAALAALTPTVTCLIGIVLQRQDVRDLRAKMNGFRSEMIALRKDIHGDLLMIHERVANVEGRQSR